MDSKNVATGRGGGVVVKVTYIETQFVTSDAAGFKDLVQRLTGRSATPPVPHRPRPCRRDYYGRRGTTTAAAGAAGLPPQAYHYTVAEARPAVITSRTPPYLHEDGMGLHDIDMCDFSDFFYVGASERSDGGFPY